MSRKQKRIAAIARRYPAWSLTDGKPTKWLHIGAAFRHLDELANVRKRLPFMTAESRAWHIAFAIPGEVKAARFCLSLYPNRLPA